MRYGRGRRNDPTFKQVNTNRKRADEPTGNQIFQARIRRYRHRFLLVRRNEHDEHFISVDQFISEKPSFEKLFKPARKLRGSLEWRVVSGYHANGRLYVNKSVVGDTPCSPRGLSNSTQTWNNWMMHLKPSHFLLISLLELHIDIQHQIQQEASQSH
jgi:hypothetical protein